MVKVPNGLFEGWFKDGLVTFKQILYSRYVRKSSFFKHIQKQPPEVFYKKGVIRNVAKFTGKHLCQSLSFNKVAALRPASLLKKRL